MGAQHIIELNGKRYDTVTGQLVNTSKTKAAPASPKPRQAHSSPRPAHPARATNGKLPTSPTPQTAPTPHKPKPAKPRPGMVDGIRRAPSAQPNHVARRHPQKSQTLMRQAARAASASAATPASSSTPTAYSQHGTLGIDTARLRRAKATPQNKLIGRFKVATSPSSVSAATPATPSLAPTPPPAAPPSIQPAAIPAARAHSFESAVAQAATSHTRPKADHHGNRTARTVRGKKVALKTLAAILVVGLAASFVVYKQMPDIHMKVASSRSGVAGVLPAYTPAGYTLSSNIDYKPGEITLNFQSNSDQRNFKVTQSESSWTSESLRQDFLEPSQANYQVVEENGKTVYLYDNNATWVDGGIWYKVEAKDAQLSGTQLANLIKGL